MCQVIGPWHTDQHPDLHQGTYTFLQEERIALRTRVSSVTEFLWCTVSSDTDLGIVSLSKEGARCPHMMSCSQESWRACMGRQEAASTVGPRCTTLLCPEDGGHVTPPQCGATVIGVCSGHGLILGYHGCGLANLVS